MLNYRVPLCFLIVLLFALDVPGQKLTLGEARYKAAQMYQMGVLMQLKAERDRFQAVRPIQEKLRTVRHSLPANIWKEYTQVGEQID